MEAARNDETSANTLSSLQGRLHLLYPDLSYLGRAFAKNFEVLVKQIAMCRQKIAFLSLHQFANPREDTLVLLNCEPICDLVVLFRVAKEPLFVSEVNQRLNETATPFRQRSTTIASSQERLDSFQQKSTDPALHQTVPA